MKLFSVFLILFVIGCGCPRPKPQPLPTKPIPPLTQIENFK